MTTRWYRVLTRLVGMTTCAVFVVLAAQWMSISFGWTPLIELDTVQRRTDRFSSTLREGPAMLVAVGLIMVGALLFVAWLLAARRTRSDRTFRVGERSRRLRIDRPSLAASLERTLESLDQRVDATVNVSRRGAVDLRLVTPDISVTGTVAEHTELLTSTMERRNLPCRLRTVDVVDVRKLKTRHRVR